MATARRGFGAIRRLPSKRFQASYLGPDLRRHVAPTTYAARIDAEGWVATERRLVETDTWTAPETRDPRRSAPTTLADFAAESFGRRRVRGEALRPRTVKLYEGLMARVIGPSLGERRLRDIRRVDVDRWYAALSPEGHAARARLRAPALDLRAGARRGRRGRTQPLRHPWCGGPPPAA
ncbi:MAG: hypothetical protein M3Y71_02875 [Actinomycetota bacterium]|nr:hypothetical protein [Actinomycetota bacterium]